jgi:hypothetical protein
MTIPDLIAMLRRRLAYLGQLRTSAEAIGDVGQVDRIDAELAETQATLNQLGSL